MSWNHRTYARGHGEASGILADEGLDMLIAVHAALPAPDDVNECEVAYRDVIAEERARSIVERPIEDGGLGATLTRTEYQDMSTGYSAPRIEAAS